MALRSERIAQRTYFGEIMNKEFIDQPLHVLAGAALVVAFSFITSLWMAALISAMTGLVREIYQRYDQNRKWYDFGAGSRIDLCFWALGVLVGIAVGIMAFPI